MTRDMNTGFIEDIFFPLLRAGMGTDNGIVSGEIDYNALLSLGRRQSVLPLIRQGLKKSGISGEGFDLIDGSCKNDICKYVFREVALGSIRKNFDGGSIPYVPLKGSVLKDLYPEPWMRTSTDIDVLIHEEDVERAAELLESRTDFKVGTRNYHDVLLSNGKVFLELHFSIKESMDGIDPLLSKVWTYCEPSGKGSEYSMSPEYQLFHSVAHMAYHLTHGGLGVRPYIDLWLLRNKTEFDAKAVEQMCASCGILKFYETSCRLSDVWFSGAEHTELTAALERFCFEGGVFGTDKNAASSNLRERNKTGYVFRRMFPKKEMMSEQYPILRKKGFLLPVYYVVRLAEGLFKKHKKPMEEINLLKSIEKEDVEAMDRFLKTMGL